MIVDIHAHLVDRRYVEELAADTGFAAQTTANGQTLMRKDGHTVLWYRESMFDIGARLRDMDDKGIGMRALCISTPNVYAWHGARQIEMARYMNDVTADIVRRYPDRFAGFASLPLEDVGASLSEIDRISGELGLHGVMIGSNIAGQPVNHPRFDPVWARIDALRLAVFEHPMFPAHTADMEEYELPLRVGFVFDTTLAASRLIYSGVFERYPNFPYIMAHTGGALLMILERLDNGYRLFPDCRRNIDRLPSEYAKKLYYDSASFYAPALELALTVVGADHLLWGSDDPFIGADTEHVASLAIPEADKMKILGCNAARLLGLGAAG